MKVLPFKIPKSKNIGLIYQEDKGAVFYDKLHQHDEIQICYIVKGEGALVVGDLVSTYRTNDILVIGGNQPHVFKSDTSRIKDCKMISLFFTKKSFGSDFFDLDDFKDLIPFFTTAKTSFRIVSDTRQFISFFDAISRGNDLEVNPIKTKQLTNIRASGKDDAVRLTPPKKFSLETAIAYISEDELVEVTPKSIRLRKSLLKQSDRKRAARKK